MAQPQAAKEKEATLARFGAVNPHLERVTDAAFSSNPFFDARDLVQVKYEIRAPALSRGLCAAPR